MREEIEEKIANLTGGKQKIRRGLSKKLGGTLAGIERESDRNQTQIKRKSNKNGTESCVNIVNAIGETFISEMERTKLLLLKDLFFENKRLDLTGC